MTTTSTDHGTRSRSPVSFGFDRFSGFYLWALFIVVFGVWTPNLFLTANTVRSVASDQAIVAMLGIALLIPLAAGAYDLSIGANINFSAVSVALLQTNQGWSMWPSIAVAVGAGALIGVINGFIVVVLRVSSFIATLGMATVIGAFMTIVTKQSQPLPPTSRSWLSLTQHKVFGFQIVVLYLLVLAVIVWWAMEHTPAGRYIYAVGGNPEAARLSGVQVGKWTWLSPHRLRRHLGRRGGLLLLALRPVADLRRGAAASRLRRRLPRLDAAQARALQRLGHADRGLRAGHRRQGLAVRHQRAVAQRHVQRRRADHRRRLRRLAAAVQGGPTRRRTWGRGRRSRSPATAARGR